MRCRAHRRGGWSTADVFGVHVVDGVRAAVHFTVEAGVNVTAGTGVGCSLSVGFSADGMAGPIPVTAGIEAELEAEAALGGALSSGGSLRVEAGGHTVGPVLLPDVAFTSPHFSLTAKELVAASAGVGLTVKAGIGAGGVASITLNVGTSLDFTAQPGSCAWAARFGQFSAEGELLEWTLSTPKTPALFTLPIGGNYCANTSPSSGGGSGGSGSGGSVGSGGGGTPPASPPPTAAPPASPTDTPIAASGNDTCTVRAGGAVECWGQDDADQLGDENFVRPEIEECSLQWCSTIPRPVTGLTGAVSIATGGDEACALLSSGGIDCWGEGEYGELGDGEWNDSAAPVAVDGIADATDVSVGEGADACAVLKTGGVDCWGADDGGELGTGTEEGPETCRGNNKCSTEPVAVSGISNATAVGVGDLGACALLATGEVKCWGDNSFDELGDGSPHTPSDVPVSVTGITTATEISVGPLNACGLLASGEVECWGENSYAQLGDGGTEASDSPVHVEGISDATAVTVEGWGACAILATGEVECWGYNGTGGLADGSFTGPETCGEATAWCSKTPTRATGVTSPTAISGGGLDACAELPGEVVECWGNNDYGQLGDASTTNSDEPVPVSGLG